MKQGWTYKKLGEVCDFEGGSQPPKSEWISHPKDGYIRMLQIRDFTKSRNADVEYVKITKRLRLCNSDDILIGRYGASVGKILTGLAGAYNVAIMKSIPDEGIIRKDYIRRYFESSLFQNLLYKVCSSRAAQAGFSKDDIKDEIVPIPPLSEQQRIVSRLDAAFAHIDELKANAEKQLSEARAIFQKALAKAMEPKEGWEENTLGEITISMADGPFGSNLKKEHYTNKKEVRIIQLSNIGEEGWREENTKYTSFYHLQTIQRSEVKPGDVVIAKMMPAGRAILCPDHEKKYVLSSDAVRATLKDGMDRRFVLFSINSSYFRKQVYANVTGSGRVRTSLTKLRDCKIYLPPLSEQQRIVARLDSLSAHVRELEEVNKKTIAECDALKQALLRKVFE